MWYSVNNNIFSYIFWRVTFEIVYHWIFGVDVIGRKNFPKEGPIIVAPNHLSNNDPMVIGHACPRPVCFMAKEELFIKPLSNFFCRCLGAFPVKRGGVDKDAIRYAMKLLKKGDVLGIFPEGTRNKPGKLGKFHDGVASMAMRTGIGVVPVAVIGTTKIQRGGVACIIGEVMPVEKQKPTAEAVEAFNAKLRERIETMISEYKASHPNFKGE